MIKDFMHFDNFCDFYSRHDAIRTMYVQLSRHDKQIYKYYVYSRRVLKEKVCDMIWGYLNVNDEELSEHINKLDKERSRYL